MILIEKNAANWTPEELRQYQARGYRARRAGEFPPVSVLVRPDDYASELQRGTIEYDPGWRNYAFHVVRFPDGAFVRGCNFSQAAPGTAALLPDGALTLIDCNLSNCLIDPAWKVENCNCAQAWRVLVDTDEGTKRETTQFVCSHPSQLKGDEHPPANAVR